MPTGVPPVELPDGRIIMPEDLVSLEDLMEIVPLILETMGAQAPGQNGITPGQPLSIAGMPGAPVGAPGAMSRPGAVGGGPTAGPAGLGGGGRGTGFSGIGGGGGRGGRGDRGPAGPAGPGTILPVIKIDGDFTIASVSPFVPVPGTKIDFDQASDGVALFFVQAVLGGNTVAGVSNGQLGLRIDGMDQPLTANLIHTFVGGARQFLASAHASFPKNLSAGPHSVEVVARGDAALGAPTGEPLTVQANATIPLALTVIHR